MTAGTAVVSVYTAGNTLLENVTVNFTTQELEAYQVVLDGSLRTFWGEQTAAPITSTTCAMATG